MSETTIYPITIQNITMYQVQAFGSYQNLSHAIFTRKGGLSDPPYTSLNLSTATGDKANTVEQNFQAVCQALDVDPQQTAASQLVHGCEVATVTTANKKQSMGVADGLITNTPGIFLFMRFADCTPLLFFDPKEEAVGLSHAGWRGTMQNMAQATLEAMARDFGSKPENILAVIGPAIGPCCYQVGTEVILATREAFAESESLLSQHNGQHAHLDLGAANRQQLKAAGVQHIIESNLCTACRTDHFFSHRAEQGKTGRFGVMIGIKETVSV